MLTGNRLLVSAIVTSHVMSSGSCLTAAGHIVRKGLLMHDLPFESSPAVAGELLGGSSTRQDVWCVSIGAKHVSNAVTSCTPNTWSVKHKAIYSKSLPQQEH